MVLLLKIVFANFLSGLILKLELKEKQMAKAHPNLFPFASLSFCWSLAHRCRRYLFHVY